MSYDAPSQNVTCVTSRGAPATPAAVALPRPPLGALVLVQLVNISLVGFDQGAALVSSVDDGCVGAATMLSNVTARHAVRDATCFANGHKHRHCHHSEWHDAIAAACT